MAKRKILIIDDDPGIRDIFSLIFTRAGYDPTVLPDGELVMQNRFEKPDIFLIDRQLSGSDGLDICRYLKSKKETKDIPVVITSASPFVGDLVINAGADDFVEKPFRKNDLIEVIEKHINSSPAVQKELKELNQTVKRKDEALEERNHELNSIGFMTSQELKEPLKRIYTSLEIILSTEAHKLTNHGKANFRMIQAAVQKMGLITDDILSFVQVNNEDLLMVREETDLNKILEQAKEKMTRRIAEKNAEIHSEELPVINGYPDLLLLLFQNILGNALKFQPPDNKPLIRISYHILDVSATGLSMLAGTYHTISFIDNGIGFAKSEANKIFSMFYKVPSSNQYKGTGIGLSVCRKIMERHDGFIKAFAKENTGAEFCCYFPLNKASDMT